ncbi:MAG TPA: hypothetical protein VNF29_03110 [Candidatus Binataceae bacterium]|nr:hypothetical protein [Candidatus Binataceae bacterium]
MSFSEGVWAFAEIVVGLTMFLFSFLWDHRLGLAALIALYQLNSIVSNTAILGTQLWEIRRLLEAQKEERGSEYNADDDAPPDAYLPYEPTGTSEEDVANASEFLRTELANAAKPVSELFATALKFGISKASLYRAARIMRITKRKEGGTGADGRWVWDLGTEHRSDDET